MQITGTITQVGVLGQPTGAYNIMYQDITITGASGKAMIGNIGSKKGYAINTQIVVDVTEDPQYGTKFKRVDPKYAGQGVQPYQPAPQQPATEPKVDWDAIAKGKTRCSIACAYIASGKEPEIKLVDYWLEYIMTGQAPMPPAKTTTEQTAPSSDSDVPY